jgi:hypothetical protein
VMWIGEVSNPGRRDLARISRRGHFDPARAGALHEAGGLGFLDELVDMRASSCLALRNHDPVEVRGRLPAGSRCRGVDNGTRPFRRCDLATNAAAICGVLSMALMIDRKCGRRARPRIVS